MKPVFTKDNDVNTDYGTIPWDSVNNRPIDWRGEAGRIWENLKEVYGITEPDPYVAPPPTADEIRREAFKADVDRQDIVSALAASTPAQVETYIRNRINADSVTTQAEAIQCLKRIETSIVRLAQAVALAVGE